MVLEPATMVRLQAYCRAIPMLSLLAKELGVAKKKQKTDKNKSPKADGPRLPKRIAGIKVPKELREPGGKLLEAVRHPLVMDVAAAALMAAAAGLRKGGSGGGSGAGAPRPKPGADIGALLAATALEGVRQLGDAAARQNKGNGVSDAKGGGESSALKG